MKKYITIGMLQLTTLTTLAMNNQQNTDPQHIMITIKDPQPVVGIVDDLSDLCDANFPIGRTEPLEEKQHSPRPGHKKGQRTEYELANLYPSRLALAHFMIKTRPKNINELDAQSIADGLPENQESEEYIQAYLVTRTLNDLQQQPKDRVTRGPGSRASSANVFSTPDSESNLRNSDSENSVREYQGALDEIFLKALAQSNKKKDEIVEQRRKEAEENQKKALDNAERATILALEAAKKAQEAADKTTELNLKTQQLNKATEEAQDQSKKKYVFTVLGIIISTLTTYFSSTSSCK